MEGSAWRHLYMEHLQMSLNIVYHIHVLDKKCHMNIRDEYVIYVN